MANLASRTQKIPDHWRSPICQLSSRRCTWLALRGDALIWTFKPTTDTTVAVSVVKVTPCAVPGTTVYPALWMVEYLLAAVPILQRPGSVLVPRSCSREPPTETDSLAVGSPGAGVDHGTHSSKHPPNRRTVLFRFKSVGSLCAMFEAPDRTLARTPPTDATTLTTTCAA